MQRCAGAAARAQIRKSICSTVSPAIEIVKLGSRIEIFMVVIAIVLMHLWKKYQRAGHENILIEHTKLYTVHFHILMLIFKWITGSVQLVGNSIF